MNPPTERTVPHALVVVIASHALACGGNGTPTSPDRPSRPLSVIVTTEHRVLGAIRAVPAGGRGRNHARPDPVNRSYRPVNRSYGVAGDVEAALRTGRAST
jgi:hypothetical protein